MNKTLFKQTEGGSRMVRYKQQIINHCIYGDLSIPELSKLVSLSVPSVTKLLNELMDDGFVADMGKQSVAGGRQPIIYGLNPDAGYFIGVEIQNKGVKMMAMNFKGKILASEESAYCISDDSIASIDLLCERIKGFISRPEIPEDKILGIGVCLQGRVNAETGYSYSFMFVEEQPLAEMLGQRLGYNVYVDNDSRAATYGEYIMGAGAGEQVSAMLYINASWGLGLGMVFDGKLFYGKSGFAGEYGHFPMYDNEIICRCGKRGCLETEVSGSAVHRKFMERLKEGRKSILSDKYNRGEEITMDDILEAVLHEDVLAIEIIETVSHTLGQTLAGLINMFNPELLVLGGSLARVRDYMLLPMQSAVNKYGLRMVSKDTRIKFSKLGDDAIAVGGCLLARSRALNLI